MVENKTVLVSLDKLDQEQINALKERTGKSEVDILKFALNELHRKLVENQPDQKQPQVIFVNPPVSPYPPANPYPPPIIPFIVPPQPATIPPWPNPWEPTWAHPSWTTCSGSGVTGTTTIHIAPPTPGTTHIIDNFSFES